MTNHDKINQRISNLKFEITLMYDLLNSEKEEETPRMCSNCTCNFKNEHYTANGDVWVCAFK